MLTTTITLPNGSTIQVEVAATEKSRRIGLSRRAGLAPGHGMLLAFETPGRYKITMAAMHFDLDLLWLGNTEDPSIHRLVWHVQRATRPGLSLANPVFLPASYVLEIGAGEMQRLGIGMGDMLRF
jgi:hypothetical protein